MKELKDQSVKWIINLDVEMTQNDARVLLKRKTVLGDKILNKLGEDVGRLIDGNNKECWPMTKAVGMQVKGAVKSEGRWKKEPGRVKRSV